MSLSGVSQAKQPPGAGKWSLRVRHAPIALEVSKQFSNVGGTVLVGAHSAAAVDHKMGTGSPQKRQSSLVRSNLSRPILRKFLHNILLMIPFHHFVLKSFDEILF